MPMTLRSYIPSLLPFLLQVCLDFKVSQVSVRGQPRITNSALIFLGCRTGLNFIFGLGAAAGPPGPEPAASPPPAPAAPVLGPAAALLGAAAPGAAGLAKPEPIPPSLGGIVDVGAGGVVDKV